MADTRRLSWFIYLLFGLVLSCATLAEAGPMRPERIAWRKSPIAIELPVGSERLVHFANAVKMGVPAPLQGSLRIQTVAGTVYLLAHAPFPSTRVVVRDLENGRIYLLDLSAATDAVNSGPVTIFNPDAEHAKLEAPATQSSAVPRYGYVTLTRFAAQQLYAPARLLKDLPGVVRVPVRRVPVLLVRGDIVEAIPFIAWRAGDLFLTAVKLVNKTSQPQVLDPRTLRGAWLTATFQHHRLHRKGDEADRTVVYLISARPFAASL